MENCGGGQHPAARAAARVAELAAEVEAVLGSGGGCLAMAHLYARGMAAYRGLHALGRGFESYHDGNRQQFWPSLLQWLRYACLSHMNRMITMRAPRERDRFYLFLKDVINC